MTLIVLAQTAAATPAWLDVVKVVAPGVLALGGVWLGSGLTRGRERQAWRRDQLVSACGAFVTASSAVEQWGSSPQFAKRLAAGQYPTEYKQNLETLSAAVAALSVSTSESLATLAGDADTKLRTFVEHSAAHQGSRAHGTGPTGSDDVEAAHVSWSSSREAFLAQARTDIAALR